MFHIKRNINLKYLRLLNMGHHKYYLQRQLRCCCFFACNLISELLIAYIDIKEVVM